MTQRKLYSVHYHSLGAVCLRLSF